MFSWNISKDAEALFSRLAMKRLCQFLLKKKLGKFILGDIDLDQLNVQLGTGTIQLSDLALNADYLNEKFGATGALVKEGTIGSLMVTMPWKEGGCRVELDEVEIVLSPRKAKAYRDEYEACLNNKKNPDSVNSHDIRNTDEESCSNRMANASIEIHEGVKAIAKLIKFLLASFHVKVRGLIMAFDPCTEEGDKKGLDRMLALRIREVECGTQIFDDHSCSSFGAMHNFLGLSRLPNFLKFNGAVLELIHMDCLDHLSSPEATDGIGWRSSGDRTTGRDSVCNEGFVSSSFLMHKEPVSFILSDSHLISDWVSRREEDINDEEPDFVASVDQFFECFDELRQSQSAIGNSVMWNWTCSVFIAITVASNLATGSVQVPPE